MMRMNIKAKTWMIRIFSGLLVLSFAIWGVGDYVSNQMNLPVATVNGQPISQAEFARAYDEEYQRLRKMTNGAIDKKMAEQLGLKQQTLSMLISRRLFRETARELRLTVSPETLRQSIATTPAFFKDGRFDMATYELVLKNNNMDTKSYEAGLSNDLMNSQLELSLHTVAAVPELLLRDVFTMEREERSVEVLSLAPADLAGELAPKEEALAEYLQKHQNAFMTPVRVKLAYLLLDADSVREEVKMTTEEVKTYYDEHKREYEEPETRQVRHILAKSDGSPAQEEAARAKIAQAQARLAKKEPFAAVAKALSEDITAESGGDLGSFPRGAMVAAFEDAAFSLPVGQVSQPVKSDFGLHLILVDAINPAKVKTLADADAEIRARLLQEKAPELVYDRAEILEDQLAISSDLAHVAKELNLRYRETGFLARDDGTRQGVELANEFIDKAFATHKGEATPLFELPDNRFAALKVVDREESRAKTLDEAREEVRQAWIAEQGATLARERLAGVLKELQGGKGWEITRQVKAAKPQSLGPFTRQGGKGGVPEPVRAVAFRLSRNAPLLPQVVETQDAFLLVRLSGIKAPDDKQFAEQKETLAAQLTEEMGQEQFQAMLNGMGRRAKIEINQEELKRF